MALGEFQYEIVHRQGHRMRHVDALSRNPSESTSKSVFLTVVSKDTWVLAVQQQDKEIARIKTILESGDIQNNKQIFNQYHLKNNRVYRLTSHGSRLFVPKIVRF